MASSGKARSVTVSKSLLGGCRVMRPPSPSRPAGRVEHQVRIGGRERYSRWLPHDQIAEQEGPLQSSIVRRSGETGGRVRLFRVEVPAQELLEGLFAEVVRPQRGPGEPTRRRTGGAGHEEERDQRLPLGDRPLQLDSHPLGLSVGALPPETDLCPRLVAEDRLCQGSRRLEEDTFSIPHDPRDPVPLAERGSLGGRLDDETSVAGSEMHSLQSFQPLEARLEIGQLPDRDGLIFRGRYEPASVAGESQAADRVDVAAELTDLLPGRNVIELQARGSEAIEHGRREHRQGADRTRPRRRECEVGQLFIGLELNLPLPVSIPPEGHGPAVLADQPRRSLPGREGSPTHGSGARSLWS